MAGYIDKQVAAAQKTVADAIAGKQLKAAIKQLQDRSQVKDSLKTLPARGAITAKRSIGKRSSASISTERRTLLSSDGIFSLDYYHVLGTTNS